MHYFSFPQAYLALKVFSSNIILGIGSGITFIFSLTLSILTAIVGIELYEVPIKDVQIYSKKIYGGVEPVISRLYVNMDYGMNITEDYKKDFEPGVQLYIYPLEKFERTDSFKGFGYSKQSNKAAGVIFEYNVYDILKTFSDSFLEGEREYKLIDSIRSVFSVHFSESKLPRTYYDVDDIDTLTIYNTKVATAYGHYVSNVGQKISAIKMHTYNHIDTITGLESYGARTYVALTDSGENRPVFIPTSPDLTKSSLTSLYDVSQSYFHFIVDVPDSCSGTILSFDFGGATDFSNIYPTPDAFSMSGFCFTDLEKIRIISETGLWFHARFKQMENIQIIRMFVLTTLFAFFVAMASESLFKFLRIKSRRIRMNRLKENNKLRDNVQE